jgi:hypothetical protein
MLRILLAIFGGKSRIEGTNKWITFDDTRNENILPDTYYNVKVEGLDFSNILLSIIILKNCLLINDFDCQRSEIVC